MRSIKTTLLLLCLVVTFPVAWSPVDSAVGQVEYPVTVRPRGVGYDVVNTPHFELIYQRGLDSLVADAAAILEASVQGNGDIVGDVNRFRMPVVINGYNDASNGFVSPLNFRQEIEAPPVRSSILSAGFDSWMGAVLPHELVHATQAQVRARPGFGWLLSLVSPDLNRVLNFTIPTGMSEGAAVFRESHIWPDAGRLNHSLFQMRYRAAMAERPWRLAQMLEQPAYTHPTDRFYLGGSNLYVYLATRYGDDFFARSLRRYNRWPFFGYGYALWRATGDAPTRIGRAIRKDAQAKVLSDIAELGPLTEGRVVLERKGMDVRRPNWLDDSTIVAHVSGYRTTPGFYKISAKTGDRRAVAHESITEDYHAALSGREVLFSRYVLDLVAAGEVTANAYSLDTQTGSVTRLTQDGRVYAPVRTEGGVLAIQNHGQFGRLVWIDADGSTHTARQDNRTDYRTARRFAGGQVGSRHRPSRRHTITDPFVFVGRRQRRSVVGDGCLVPATGLDLRRDVVSGRTIPAVFLRRDGDRKRLRSRPRHRIGDETDQCSIRGIRTLTVSGRIDPGVRRVSRRAKSAGYDSV